MAKPKRFRTRTSLFMIVFELCLCGIMCAAVAMWYMYATTLVQQDVFSSRFVDKRWNCPLSEPTLSMVIMP